MSKNQGFKVFDCSVPSEGNDSDLHDEMLLKIVGAPVLSSLPTPTTDWSKVKFRNSVCFDDITFLQSAVPMNCYSTSHLEHVFSKCRMELRNSTLTGSRQPDWRQQLCDELVRFRDTLNRFPLNKKLVPKFVEAFRSYVKHLSELRLHLGYISNVSYQNSYSDHMREPQYSMFHFHLDLRWYFLTCVYKTELCRQETSLLPELRESLSIKCRSGESPLPYYVTLLVSELFQLAILKFESIAHHDLHHTPPFHCRCVRELWIMLQIFVNHMSFQPFQSIVRMLLNAVLSPSEDTTAESCAEIHIPSKYECSDPVGFSLWFLTHITQLRGYTSTGRNVGPTGNNILTDNIELLEVLTACLNSSRGVTEEQLRTYLPLVTTMACEWCEPNSEPVKLFWEYFHSRLNSGFFLRGALPQNLLTTKDSGIEMLRHVESHVTTRRSASNNSYMLFLRLLGAHLDHCVRENKMKPWLQLKGRIFSKFSRSKMTTLTEMGLHHFACLFITLALKTDLKEVWSRCKEFLSFLPTKELDLPRQRIVWKTYLAFMQLYMDKGEDFEEVVSSLMSEVQRNSDNLALMKVFITDLQVILIQQPEQQPCHLLFDNWMLPYLSHANEHDSCQVLSMVRSLVPNLPKTKSTRMSVLLLQHLLSFIKIQFGNEKIKLKEQVCDIAVEITLLAMSDQSLVGEPFTELFKYFGCSIVVNCEASCLYLVTLLRKQDILEYFEKNVPLYQQLIIQAWIRFQLLLHDSGELLIQLTEILEALPEILYLRENSGMALLDDEDEDIDLLSNFGRMVGECYSRFTEGSVKISLREKCLAYFSPIVKILDSVLSKTSSSPCSSYERLYSCVCKLVWTCGNVLYQKNKANSLLPSLVTRLFLPISCEKELHRDRLQVIKKYLHRFVYGLEKLNSPGDAYVSSTVKQLAVRYLPQWEVNEKHPLFPCFMYGAGEHILQAVSDEFLRCKGVPLHRYAETVLQFLRQLTKHHITDRKVILLVVKHCLCRLFEMAIFLPESNKKQGQLACLLVQEVLKQCDDDETREQFRGVMAEVCKHNLAFSTTPLYKLLLLVAHVRPEVMEKFLPELWDEVKRVELRRGVAYDCALRTAMKAIETELEERRAP